MKKIIKIIAASLCIATTTFAMEEDSYPETLESETQRIVFKTINSLEHLQPNLFLELAQAHIDDPETAAQCTALFNAISRFKEDFLPSIMENLQALRTKFDSPLRDIESDRNQDDPLYEPLYASDEDESLLAQRGRTRTTTNHDLLELNDSDDEEEPKQKEIIDSSLAASAAKPSNKSELLDIL